MTVGVMIRDVVDGHQVFNADFIRRYGGSVVGCQIAGAMVDVERVKDYSHRLITGGIDLSVFVTATGARRMLNQAFATVNRSRVVDSLQDITTVAANDAVRNVLRDLGIEPTISVQRMASWRDVLSAIDQFFLAKSRGESRIGAALGLANLRVGLEESRHVHSLSAGFEARGCEVIRVPVFKLPGQQMTIDDKLEPFFASLEHGEIDAVLFSSPEAVAAFSHKAKRIKSAHWTNQILLEKVVIAVGNDTAEILRDQELPVDVVVISPNESESDDGVAARIETSQKQKRHSRMQMSSPASSSNDSSAPWFDSQFMRACRGETTDVTPIWMLRQAGRYMAEYREVRAKIGFLELCANPQLCSEVMCTAVERLGVDAAIIFSDLLPILVPMGCELEFTKGDGPKIHNPIREAADVDRIQPLETNEPLSFVMETVRQTRADLPDDLPLIGFAGSPFTLASYMIEGGASRNFALTKAFMYSDPGAWQQLMQHLTHSISLYLNGQVQAGAQCVQLFDSWAGCLSFEDYRQFAFPHVRQIIASLPAGVPVINFATGNPALLPLLADTPANVIGIDWRTRLDDAWQTVGFEKSVQGNLDPTVLLTNPAEIRRQAKIVLDQAAGRPGHIFNLGHGILPQTPVDNAIALVDAVHELSSK